MPALLTAFVGRDRELAELEARLGNADCRLLTLVGPGGTGKTRLAAELAHRQVDTFAQGVCWVDLQAVDDITRLATAVADGLALPESGEDQRDLLLYGLKNQNLLLVLDNFEQIKKGAGLLVDILRHAPGVKFLVTSREALNLQEEWHYPLHGLAIPPAGLDAWQDVAGFGAVQLFATHARRVRPSFDPESEASGIARVCRLVEGSPLALEMAAAWARVLDSDAIAAEIEESLGFLTAEAWNVPERHRSMQSILEHSWGKLAPEERAICRRLSVFRGGFSREAADAVAGAALATLTRFVDRSFLRWGADGRYWMHELMRQFAYARACGYPGEVLKSLQRHAEYFARFLHERTAHTLDGRQQAVTGEIAVEMDNIRAAWEWATAFRRSDLIQMAVESITMYCQLQSKYLEGRRFCYQVLDRAVAREPEAAPVVARVSSELGWFQIRLGQFVAAEQAFRRAQEIYREQEMGPPAGHSTDPRLGLSALAAIRGAHEEAARFAEAALATATTQENLWNVATANYLLAESARARGEYRQAHRYATAAHAATEQVQDRWFMAYCLYELGQAAAALGDYTTARRHLQACYALREAFQDPEGMALAMNSLGDVACRQQRLDEAESLFQKSVGIYRQIKDQGGLAAAHHGLGRVALAREAWDGAREALRQALQIAGDIDFVTQQLAVLADVGELLVRTGRLQPGLSLLTLVRDDPAADREIRNDVTQRLHHYEAHISPALFGAAGAPLDLQTATSAALAELLLPASQTPDLPPPAAPAAASPLVEPLTDREMEVLRHLAQGKTNRQIADALTVVVGTIKAHNNRIYGKLGVGNRTQAVARARELGLIS